MRLPEGFLQQLIEYRHYATAKALVDSATTPEARRTLRRSEMVQLVEQIRFDLVRGGPQ